MGEKGGREKEFGGDRESGREGEGSGERGRERGEMSVIWEKEWARNEVTWEGGGEGGRDSVACSQEVEICEKFINPSRYLNALNILFLNSFLRVSIHIIFFSYSFMLFRLL